MYLLSLEIRHGKFRTFISQEAYSMDILKKNKMEEFKPGATPM